jgi:hypothetical protein
MYSHETQVSNKLQNYKQNKRKKCRTRFGDQCHKFHMFDDSCTIDIMSYILKSIN